MYCNIVILLSPRRGGGVQLVMDGGCGVDGNYLVPQDIVNEGQTSKPSWFSD